jgi:hypothetical protein
MDHYRDCRRPGVRGWGTGGARRPSTARLGAAWKVLDLLLELACANAGTTAASGRLTIAKKESLARKGHGTLAPLTTDRALWRTLTSTYAATTRARHSLVHRRAEVDPATGTLTGRDDSGQPSLPA